MLPMWLWALLACAVAVAGDMFLDIDITSDLKYDYTFSGYNIYLFDKPGRRIFNFSDESLHVGAKKCMETNETIANITLYQHGPDSLVHSENKWLKINRTVIPGKCKFRLNKYDTVVLMEKTFYNNSTSDATYDIGLSYTVEESIRTYWEKRMRYSKTYSANYEVGFNLLHISVLFPVGGSYEFTSIIGSSNKSTITTTIGASSGMSMVLKSNQSVRAQLLVTKGEIIAVCDYIHYLTGEAVVRFDNEVKSPGDQRKHKAWDICIPTLMQKSNVPNTAVTKGQVAVSMYFEGKINVYDVSMNSAISPNSPIQEWIL